MGTSKKSHRVGKAERGKSEKPQNLAERELDVRQAGAVRGGVKSSDINIVKVTDKPST